MSDFIITDFTPPAGRGRGLETRDYSKNPVGYNSKPFDIPLIPESQWQGLLDKQKAAKAQLHNIRDTGNNGGRIPSTDQMQTNFCWAHSSTGAVMLLRARQNEPFVPLSATAIACKIKNFRNVGGWGAESLEYIAEHGVPSLTYWPQGNEGIKKHYDSPTTWENAAKHKVTEWMDMQPRSKAQLVTCLLLNIPVVSDFSWWGHSVVTLSLMSLNPFRTLIWNSWGDAWGDNGTGILEGSKAIPDGMIAPRSISGN